jgi:hypothetical protein
MNWKAILAGVMLVLVVGGVATLAKRQSVRFEDLNAAKSDFRAAGYYCVADSVDERHCNGFLISRETIARESVNSMRKVGEMGPAWKGKAWVTLNPGCCRLEFTPDDAATRTWGNVVAFGDADLLRELDAILNPAPGLF